MKLSFHLAQQEVDSAKNSLSYYVFVTLVKK